MAKKPERLAKLPVLDVLVLHGRQMEMVDYLCNLCLSLGLSASCVERLPTLGRNLNGRVSYYAQSCRLRLVLATFDDENPQSNQVRPNVIDELRICKEHDKKPTLILREVRDGKQPTLQSNLDNHFAFLDFTFSKLHEFVPAFIRELKQLLSIDVFESPAEKRFAAGRDLNAFLDKMDAIWDDEFDQAWLVIHQLDYQAERDFAVQLDLFFQCYHDAFRAFTKTPHDRPRLRETFANELKSAQETSKRAWRVVAQGRLRHAHPKKADNVLDEANSEFRHGEKASTTIEAIERYKKVITLLK